MGIQVAQLSIVVQADTTQPTAALAALNASFAQVAQAAVAGAQQEVGSQAQVVEAISAVVMASRQQTAAIQESTQATVAAMDGLSGKARQVQANVSGIGSAGSRGLLQLNQALSVSGQAITPVTNGLYLLSSQLTAMPATASTASRALMGTAAAISAIAAAAIALGGPQIQQLANLKQSLIDGGKAWNDYADTVQHAIDIGAGFGHNQGEVAKSLAQLAAITKDQTQLAYAYQVSEDVAARRGIGLAQATDIVVRGMEGQSRGLRVLGVQMSLVANPAKALESANLALANSQQTAKNATDAYDAALQKYNDGLTIAALKVDQLKQATDALAQAQQKMDDLIAKNAAEDLAIHVSHAEQAVRSLADAQQHLADVQLKQAVESEQPKIDKVADATDRLTLANVRLIEVQNRKQAALVIGPGDLEKLAAASDKVLVAQERLAAAQGGDILAAQNSLRTAVDQQRAALDAQHDKQQTQMADISGLLSAQMDVKHSVEALAIAQQEAYQESIGRTPKQVQDQIEIRDAIQKVTDAQNALVIAQSQDNSEQALKAISRANDMRDATEGIEKAQQGIVQAHRDAEAAALRQRDAYLTVVSAHDAMVTAQGRVREAMDKVATAQDAVNNQAQRVLDAINEKTKGTAAAMEDTWAGTLKRWKADFENFLGDFSQGAGRWAVLLAPVLLMMQLIRGTMAGAAVGGAVAGGEAAVGAAAGGEGILAGIGAIIGTATGILEIVALIALVSLGIYELTQHWDEFKAGLDIIWQKIQESYEAGRAWIADRLEQIIGYMRDLPGRIRDALGDLGSWLYNSGRDLLVGLWNGLADFWNDTFLPFLQSVGDRVGSAVGDAASWLYDTGWNALVGLWNGMVDFYNQYIGGPLGGLFGGIVDIANFALGNASPSKKFHEVGKNVMEGLMLGIMDNHHKPLNAITDLAGKMAGQQFKVGGAGGVGVNVADSLSSQIIHLVNNYVDLKVAGSVATERDIVESVKDALVDVGRGKGGDLFGGYG